MKTLLFTLEYPPFFGGVSKYYGKIVEYWPERYDILVLHNNENRLINKSLPFFKWLPSISALYRTIRDNKIEQVIIGQVLPLGIPVLVVLKLLNFKYSVFLHGMDYFYAKKKFRKKWIMLKVLKKAERIVCNSKNIADQVKNDNPAFAERIYSVNPGVDGYDCSDDEMMAAKKKFNITDQLVLLSVGRLVKRKGVDKTLEALENVYEKLPDFKYLIAGSGPDESYIKEKIEKLPAQLKNKIMMAGKVSDIEKWALFYLCDIFIMPVREIKGDVEGFGIVYLEANLAGKPVIAGDSGGVKDAVIDDFNGLVVNPEVISDIVNALLKLSKDEEYRLKLGSQGRLRALNDFRWEDQTKKVYDIISHNE